MATVRQLPTPVNVEVVAGDPFTVTFTATSGVTTFASPAVTVTTAAGDAYTTDPGVPTASAASAVLTCTWSAADTAALNTSTRAKAYKYSVEATADGGGAYQIFGGTLTVHPVGTTGTGTTATQSASLTLGGAAVTATVALSGGGATALIVQEGDSTVVAAADTLDFGAGFDVTVSPSGEGNVALDLTEYAGGALPITGGGTGATSASAALSALGAPTTLAELDDVSASSPTTGDVLTFDGSDWVPDPIEIDLSSATAVTPTTSDYVVGTDTSNADANAKFLVSDILALATTGVVVQEADSTVVASATTLDFGAGFDVTESPSGEANIALDLSEPGAVTPAIADTVAGSDASNSSANATFTVENLANVPWSSEFVRNRYRSFTDCTFTATSQFENDYNTSVASGAISQAAGVAGRPGITALSTSTSATGIARIVHGAAILFGAGEWVFECAINIPTLSTSGERYTLRAGFLDSFTASASTDGAFFEYQEATSANWRYGTYSNTSANMANSSTAVAAATWTRLKIVVNAAASLVEFFVDDVSVGTSSSFVPSGAGRETNAGVVLAKSVGTTARTVEVDYILITADLTSAR